MSTSFIDDTTFDCKLSCQRKRMVIVRACLQILLAQIAMALSCGNGLRKAVARGRCVQSSQSSLSGAAEWPA